MLTVLLTVLVAVGRAEGLAAAFHPNAVLAGGRRSVNRTVGGLDLTFNERTPPPAGSLDLFSARLDGTLTAPEPGPLGLVVVTNGAVRVWLDGEPPRCAPGGGGADLPLKTTS